MFITELNNGDIFELKEKNKRFAGCDFIQFVSNEYSGYFVDVKNKFGDFQSKTMKVKKAIDWVNKNCIIKEKDIKNIQLCNWSQKDVGMMGFHDYEYRTDCKENFDVDKLKVSGLKGKIKYCPNCGRKINYL